MSPQRRARGLEPYQVLEYMGWLFFVLMASFIGASYIVENYGRGAGRIFQAIMIIVAFLGVWHLKRSS
jgi:hypothetical protein